MVNVEPQKIVIFDLDGTLADITERRLLLETSPKNWTAFFSNMENDPPHKAVVDLFFALKISGLYRLIIVTGRPSNYRAETLRWLEKFSIEAEEMYMRTEGDRREDHIVKQEILEKILNLGGEIAFAVDDRNSVVQMWRRNGITCFQCMDGNF